MRPRRLLLVTVLLLLCAPAAARERWRLGDLFELPASLSLSVQHRWRFESLDDQFRANRSGHDRALLVRTTAHGRWRATDAFTVGAELLDSRAWPGERSVSLNTGVVNAAELLQAYGELALEGPFSGSTLLRGGRLTMDVGSRRFVARNRFRNTMNAFTGVDAKWSSEEGVELRAFYTLPVQRYPTDQSDLHDNEAEFDQETFDLQFWGLFAAAPLPWFDRAELFLFGLHEDDRARRPSRNRELYTPGFRLLKKPAASAFDVQLETALQFGESRASTSATRDLDHFAHFHHAELGYSFDAPFSPRVALQYDYASGDDSPNDGRNERFDTLFGARRFDFGPTSLYGPFARSNINTPGLRVQLKPAPRWSAFVAYRAFWLASDRDTWTTSGVRDPSGDTSRFVGSQLELRVRWDVLPGNVRLESGLAHLFSGEFMEDAPNANGQGDPTYVYTQAVVSF